MVPAKVWTLVSILTWPLCLGAIGEQAASSAESWGSHLGELWPAAAARAVKRAGGATDRPPPQPLDGSQRPPAEASTVPAPEAPNSPQSGASPGPSRQAPKPATPRRAVRPPAPAGVRVSQQRVLQLAQARAVPEAVPTGAVAGRPAGLLLRGVSKLGLGVHDGDVLSHVSGVAVTSVSQVVSLVLQARGRQAPSIGATLWRGAQSVPLIVEMPYVTSAPTANDPPATDSSTRGDLRTPPMGLGTEHGSNRQMHQTPPRVGGAG